MELTSSTCTTHKNTYSEDYIEEEIMKYVRNASSVKDALHNLRRILKQYDRRKSAWECFKMFIKKI